jgi:hypothetical protein
MKHPNASACPLPVLYVCSLGFVVSGALSTSACIKDNLGIMAIESGFVQSSIGRAVAQVKKNDPKNDDPGHNIFFGSGPFFLPMGDPKKWHHLVFLKSLLIISVYHTFF